MRDAEASMHAMIYDVASHMALNANENKMSQNVLPHLALPLSTQLLSGLDYCLPVLSQIEYITSFSEFANPDTHVTQALLELISRVKFELRDDGMRVIFSPTTFSNVQMATDMQVTGNMLSFGTYTFDLTQLHAFLLMCVDLFRSLEAIGTGKKDTLEALRKKYEPEVTSWKAYHSACTTSLTKRMSGASSASL